MERTFKLYDFNVYSNNETSSSGSEEEYQTHRDSSNYMIQMFGINEQGKSACILVEGFKPFFYAMVDDSWDMAKKTRFNESIKGKLGKYYEKCITDCKLIKRKKLYGFDGGKEHKFVRFDFENVLAFNKAKGLWYGAYTKTENGRGDRKLLPEGLVFEGTSTRLYEANIPPLLRFFHIQEISPSGWVSLPIKKSFEVSGSDKKTNCDFEYVIDCKEIVPLNDKETRVPYKICSFDIEASSSHGDFPVPVKSYKKLSTNIVEYFEKMTDAITPDACKELLTRIIQVAFGFDKSMDEIDLVYPKKQPTKAEVATMTTKWLNAQARFINKTEQQKTNSIESLFAKMHQDEEQDDAESFGFKKYTKAYAKNTATIVDILCDKKFEREGKLNELTYSLNATFPGLEGDKVTFIGSTFLRYGESDPYKNHCIVLNTCSKLAVENSEQESYSTEKEVLLAWQRLIQRENPDIIIGYNIFGFDYNFMFHRAEENKCTAQFLKLSRNIDEVCAEKDRDSHQYKIEETTIQIASGQHDLHFIKMNGRFQIDLYNFFRREENLTSYKLDYVAGHFIGDFVKKLDVDRTAGITTIHTTNLTGLLEGSYIHFEEIAHTVDYYNDGAKYQVGLVNKKEKWFQLARTDVSPDMQKKVRWCMAKDDVTPKDIFQMTNGTDDDRAIIAKYCIQDCNLVHYLMNKVDVLTGFVEMAKICSVPMNYLVMRGQGIKLTSYIAKKCREKRTLMPVMEKGDLDDGFEGAIVLEPKCDLYLDNPVACVDYASLYPSSMMSENLSHDSKVWTREYDLAGNMIEETGEKGKDGNFLYGNLPGYEYVQVTYDTYVYVRKSPSAAAEKIKSGRKICCFAQFPAGTRAIMPSILEELLTARKTTRKLIPQQTDDFIKNVLDKRQLGYKLTANSLYGQCGAKTSTFYEKDVAASTTATGRLLLTYAKRIIEECYGNAIVNTDNHGSVRTKAEYIYGDTDSVFFTFNLQTLDGIPIRGKQALEITIDVAQQAGHLASSFLKGPHDLEYEKTFMPFCLLSKKRYVGMLYETDANKCKRKEMGIVLKRRDNAPIVKDIYGGIIDILMKQQDIQKAMDFLRGCLQNIVDEKYPMEKLVITKSLRSGYKNPMQIAHKVLADRITSRDPGNKPSSGDRIPFVYIHNTSKTALQGEKIETPTYIVENNLKIDYSFYITNQIMKPVQQVFALVLEKIWTMQNKKTKLMKFKNEVKSLEASCDPEKFEDKLEQLKNKEVKALLFDEYLRETNNAKAGTQAMTSFFKTKTK
jgi:DNA polymerase elongation subunit (family B)